MRKEQLSVLVAILLTIPSLTAAHYQYSSVDFPGALRTRVFAINNEQQYVGAYWDVAGDIHAIFFDGHELASLNLEATLGTVSKTRAFALNNRGAIVGQYNDSFGNTHGYVFHNGVAMPIDYPGASWTAAYGVNDRDTIIGLFGASDGSTHAFALRHNVFKNIDIPGGQTVPLSVNDRDTVVGEFVDVPGTAGHGYLQLPNGEFTLYDVPGAPPNSTFFISINNLDEILGEYFPTNSYQNFILNDDTLVPFNLGGGIAPTYVSAQTINDHQDVVGWFDDAVGEHGFLALKERGHGRDD